MAAPGQPGNLLCNSEMAEAAHFKTENIMNRENEIEKYGHREHGEVKMGEYGTGSGSDKIHTDGLSTCVRIAVTGKYPGGTNHGYDRFLAHVAETTKKAALQGLINAVEEAKRSGLQISEVVVIVADLQDNKDYEENPDKYEKDEPEQDAFNHLVATGINALAGAHKVEFVEHGSDNHYYLEIQPDKEISYHGRE